MDQQSRSQTARETQDDNAVLSIENVLRQIKVSFVSLQFFLVPHSWLMQFDY